MGNNYKRSNEAGTKSKNRNVRDIYRDTSEFDVHGTVHE